MHGDNCIVQVNDGSIHGGGRWFWRCPRGWDYYAPGNCKFTKWVDPPAIDPYQEYIAYLHLIIADLKREIDNTPAPEDDTAEDDEDDHAARSADVICSDPICCCPCHINKSQPPPPSIDPPSGYYMPSQNLGGSVFSVGGYNSFE
ncbi:unnamed protein product [Urochloa humidicola]